MTSSLFRQQAIAQQKDRLFGEVIISQPFSFYLITFGTLIVVSSVTLLLIYGTYARRETVVGYLVPDNGLVKVYAPLQGVLTQRHVNEGASVVKDEVLFTISTLQSDAQGGDRDALLLAELQQQKASLAEKITQETALNTARQNTLQSQIDGAKNERDQLAESTTLQRQQYQLAHEKYIDYQTLSKQGHIAQAQLKDAQQAALDLEVRLQNSQRQQIQLDNRMSDLAHQKIQAPLEWQSRLGDLTRSVSDIEQRIVEISGRRIYTIRAPISGRLTALQISEGQTVSTQSPLIAILPTGTNLHAELFLPTRAAGFIAPNQNVYFRYGAFPYQHFGLYLGKVDNIAQVILAPNELPIPVSLNEPVYRVKVKLEQQTVAAYGKQFPLQAGMLLDADIVLENRSLAEWLFEPIYSLRGKL